MKIKAIILGGTICALSACGYKPECGSEETLAGLKQTVFEVISKYKNINLPKESIQITEVVTKAAAEDKKNVTCSAKLTINAPKDDVVAAEKMFSDDGFLLRVVLNSPTVRSIEKVNQALQSSSSSGGFSREFVSGLAKGLRADGPAKIESTNGIISNEFGFKVDKLEGSNEKSKFKIVLDLPKPLVTSLTFVDIAKEAKGNFPLKDAISVLKNYITTVIANLDNDGISGENTTIESLTKLIGNLAAEVFLDFKIIKSGDKYFAGGKIKNSDREVYADVNKSLEGTLACVITGESEAPIKFGCEMGKTPN
jgi:hypothetical protein